MVNCCSGAAALGVTSAGEREGCGAWLGNTFAGGVKADGSGDTGGEGVASKLVPTERAVSVVTTPEKTCKGRHTYFHSCLS